MCAWWRLRKPDGGGEKLAGQDLGNPGGEGHIQEVGAWPRLLEGNQLAGRWDAMYGRHSVKRRSIALMSVSSFDILGDDLRT